MGFSVLFPDDLFILSFLAFWVNSVVSPLPCPHHDLEGMGIISSTQVYSINTLSIM
jgi:hypothetical protein